MTVIRTGDEGRYASQMRWGLVPFWAKDLSIGSKLINARAETVAEKPAFRAALKKRRCLIPADGFYEWKYEGKGPKQPYRFVVNDSELFAFAGLWKTWDKDGEVIVTCTIITGEPNAVAKQIHNRMPVILLPEVYDHWLTGDDGEQLKPYPAEELTAYKVSRTVNSPKNDTPECIEALT